MFSLFQRSTDSALIRPLTTDDWADLEAMIASDPVAFLYAAEHLDHFGLPSPSALNNYRSAHGFMGIFEPLEEEAALANPGVDQPVAGDAGWTTSLGQVLPPQVRAAAQKFLTPLSQRVQPGAPAGSSLAGQSETLASAPVSRAGNSRFRLVGAFWLGANCVPLVIPEKHRKLVAAVVARSARTIASIFGYAHDVNALWELLEHRMGKPLSVRPHQPLLTLTNDLALAPLAASSLVRENFAVPQIEQGARWARTSDRPSLLKASVAMFTEEVGYDPLSRDPRGYTRRIDEFVRTGRTVVAVNTENVVVFKADLGLAFGDTCQIQGVWLHPAYRGQGLSAPLLAQAFQLIQSRFPTISLYVNDYNFRARKLYDRLGMEQAGTFATVLF